MVATKYYHSQATPSTVASFESGGTQRKYSWMSSGTNSIESGNSNGHYHHHQIGSPSPATPGGGATRTPDNRRNCAPFSYATTTTTTPGVTPRNDPPAASIAPRSSPSGSKENRYNHHYPVNHCNIMQPQLTPDDKRYQHRNDSNSAEETDQRPFADTGNSSSSNNSSSTESPKSQAELNRSYRQKMARYNRVLVASQKETGRNLKNLRPLAIRTAEFC